MPSIELAGGGAKALFVHAEGVLGLVKEGLATSAAGVGVLLAGHLVGHLLAGGLLGVGDGVTERWMSVFVTVESRECGE